MSWYRNWKLRAKLMASMIVLALITGIIGYTNMSSMSSVNSNSEKMYNNNFLPSIELTKFQANLLQILLDHKSALYERKPELLQSRLDEIDKLALEDNKILEDYKKTMTAGEETNLYNNIMTSLTSYRETRSANIELVKEQKYDEAVADYSRVDETKTKLKDNLQKLIDYNTKTAANQLKSNNNEFKSASTIAIILTIVNMLLAIIISSFLSRFIGKPLNKLIEVANKMAEGDLDVEIEASTKDEVGLLGQAFKRMNDHLNEVMSQINSASEQVASGAKQVSDSSMELSQGATEQASSIEQLTASIEEISSQTKNNASNAANANELAVLAQQDAAKGNERMAEMLKSMEDINESSSNISKIIKVIDEIAFQTNILALNAAVEAARAGQHGKGFAVVAEEVRNLAARSADAAKETTALIEGSIKKVEGGTKIATETADALNKIVDGVAKVASLVNDITIASNEQASGIAQINQGIVQVSQVVQTNSATSEESAAASEELSSQAELLSKTVRRFKLKRGGRSFSHSEEISPDVLKMIEQMEENKHALKEVAATRHTIDLSDRDFGKY
jgi:methyl-accepting chemotaxis protein